VIRKMVWKSGAMRRHRLIALSDQFHSMSWELLEANPPVETIAKVSTLSCFRISETNSTLVQWEAEYSSGVPSDLILYEQRSFQENLTEMRLAFMSTKAPTLYHVREAPSSRVIWLASELGIPLKVLEIESSIPKTSATSLRESQGIERASSKGGIVASYSEGEISILESGAIVMHLLEKHDSFEKLIPKKGTQERSKFHQFFFYSTSTMDHLLLESYKHMFVVKQGQISEEIVDANKKLWDENIVGDLTKELKNGKYICGHHFTAADIMVGWSCYTANLLGWLDPHPELKNYFERLTQRPAYLRCFAETEF